MSEFLEPPPLRRTVSTPSVDFHHHLATYFDPSTPLSGVPEDNEQDTVMPNMIFLSNNELEMPSTPLNRSYSMPYYAAAMQPQEQQQHHLHHNPNNHNYSLTPGGPHSSPFQSAFKANKSLYTPMQVNGLMTPVSSSHAVRTNSSPSICNSSSSGANAFLTPMTPSNTVPTFKDHRAGVKLEFDSMSSSATARSTPIPSPVGVNPFYSPPSYMMNSMTTTNITHPTTPPNDRKLQVASAAAQALDVRSFTPPEYNTSCLDSDVSNGSSMIPSPASSNEYQAFLESVSPLDKSVPQLVRPQPKRLQRASSYSMASSARLGLLPSSPSPISGISKPHRCDSCNKSFRRLEHLKRHMKIHTAERPFICDVHACNRRFSRSDNLRAHRRTHMKEGGRNKFVENLPEI